MSEDDNVILFPVDKIKDISRTGPTEKSKVSVEDAEALKRIQDDQTKKFCEGAVDDIGMSILRHFVELAVKTDNVNFTRDLALVIEMIRGLIYRDFGLKHPAQELVNKMVSIKISKNGQQSAKINYNTVLNLKQLSNPLSKDVKQELKDLRDGAGVFTGDDLNKDD